MNILVGAENPQLQGDINAIQVYGNVYNGPTEVTNTTGASWKGALVGIHFYSFSLT